mgnify:FL=1|tara:strand:+ start:72 stop:287 length:216 start_codon:yes stop_codon:yes gene_type:complete
MTPFEQNQHFPETFARSLGFLIAVKEYVRVSEEVEQESLAAVMKGDIALVAELAQYRQSLDKAIVLNSAEA